MEAQDIGVIVGRFQVGELSDVYRKNIEAVMGSHKRVVVFLRESPALITRRNPLDLETRKAMILEAYPGITVLSIPDHPSDKEWSKDLDRRIREVYPAGSVMMYGSMKSLISHYSGNFETREMEPDAFPHACKKHEVSAEVKASPEFRAGMIFAACNQYAKVYPTVDVAVFHEGKLLLARKPSADGYRFIGGFTDPSDASYEEAAKREVMEEACIDISNPEYVGSTRVEDWRYMDEEDKIITTLFMARYVKGEIDPQDDISELRWFNWDELEESLFVTEHKPLFRLLKEKMDVINNL